MEMANRLYKAYKVVLIRTSTTQRTFSSAKMAAALQIIGELGMLRVIVYKKRYLT